MEYNLTILEKLIYSIIIEIGILVPILVYIVYVLAIRYFKDSEYTKDGSIPASLAFYAMITHLPSLIFLSVTKFNGIGYIIIGTLNILVLFLSWTLSK